MARTQTDQTKFGEQPAKKALRRELWTVQDAADEIGVTKSHLLHVLRGDTRPSPKALEGLSRLLGKKPRDLFTDQVLSKPYDPKRIAWAEARVRAGVHKGGQR